MWPIIFKFIVFKLLIKYVFVTVNMSEPNTDHIDSVEEELEVESNYKPPPEKTIEQILETDKEDESLRKYKETLLGEAKSGGVVVGAHFTKYLK